MPKTTKKEKDKQRRESVKMKDTKPSTTTAKRKRSNIVSDDSDSDISTPQSNTDSIPNIVPPSPIPSITSSVVSSPSASSYQLFPSYSHFNRTLANVVPFSPNSSDIQSDIDSPRSSIQLPYAIPSPIRTKQSPSRTPSVSPSIASSVQLSPVKQSESKVKSLKDSPFQFAVPASPFKPSDALPFLPPLPPFPIREDEEENIRSFPNLIQPILRPWTSIDFGVGIGVFNEGKNKIKGDAPFPFKPCSILQPLLHNPLLDPSFTTAIYPHIDEDDYEQEQRRHQQVKWFTDQHSDQYVPKELLFDLLFEDEQEWKQQQSLQLQGNCLVNLNGTTFGFQDHEQLIIHPYGPIMDNLTVSILTIPDFSSSNSSNCTLEPLADFALPSTIHQIVKTADIKQSTTYQHSSDEENSFIVSRTLNSSFVHSLQSALTEDEELQLSFQSVDTVTSDSPLLHIAANPLLPTEFISLASDGSLLLWNLDDVGSNRVVVFPAELEEDQSFGRIAYAQHPRQLLLATPHAVQQIDLRVPYSSFTSQSLQLPPFIEPAPKTKYQRYNASIPDRIWSINVNTENMFEFAVVTSHYLMLFDLRYAKKSLLEWQHHEYPTVATQLEFSTMGDEQCILTWNNSAQVKCYPFTPANNHHGLPYHSTSSPFRIHSFSHLSTSIRSHHSNDTSHQLTGVLSVRRDDSSFEVLQLNRTGSIISQTFGNETTEAVVQPVSENPTKHSNEMVKILLGEDEIDKKEDEEKKVELPIPHHKQDFSNVFHYLIYGRPDTIDIVTLSTNIVIKCINECKEELLKFMQLPKTLHEITCWLLDSDFLPVPTTALSSSSANQTSFPTSPHIPLSLRISSETVSVYARSVYSALHTFVYQDQHDHSRSHVEEVPKQEIERQDSLGDEIPGLEEMVQQHPSYKLFHYHLQIPFPESTSFDSMLPNTLRPCSCSSPQSSSDSDCCCSPLCSSPYCLKLFTSVYHVHESIVPLDWPQPEERKEDEKNIAPVDLTQNLDFLLGAVSQESVLLPLESSSPSHSFTTAPLSSTPSNPYAFSDLLQHYTAQWQHWQYCVDEDDADNWRREEELYHAETAAANLPINMQTAAEEDEMFLDDGMESEPDYD